ncbi:MAG: NADH-quinone oxidoreductase subunit M [Deltaproteobacteria bacterium]|nr:NADH-quinone oxidoreductase subunit M [Deltaproteobacteria bacterium]
MDFTQIPILSILTFLPLVGALVLLCLPKQGVGGLRGWTLLVSVVNFVLSIPLWFQFDSANGGMQFVEQAPWFPSAGIGYHLGIDGISLFLVLLTTFLTVICVLSSWSVEKNVKEYMFFFLALETGMLGALVSLDLFLFYIFWEAMLIPMYFLIGVWGGKERIYAAVKFFIYTMVGSLLMLVAILVLYYLNIQAGNAPTFDLLKLTTLRIAPSVQFWMFAAFALAFAIKVPMWPLHTWLPDAHTQAPTAGSVILAGVLLKMGTYGYLRFAMPLFPNATEQFTPFMMGLAVIGIIYGALVAMVQTDVKKLVAYSSVSHLGFVMLGLFSMNMQGVEGGIYQSLNHGISTGALFLLVGVIYERRHTRAIADFGGLAKSMPNYAAVFSVITMSSIGLPGLNGFVGEFLIMLGAFLASKPAAILAASGVILGAAYMLWMYKRVFFGPLDKEANQNLPDLTRLEWGYLIPMIFMAFWMGIRPGDFLRKMDTSVALWLQNAQAKKIACLELEKTPGIKAASMLALPTAAPVGAVQVPGAPAPTEGAPPGVLGTQPVR